ncbi:MAG TPA: response regulator [Oculatellaceae cyanobacterium]
MDYSECRPVDILIVDDDPMQFDLMSEAFEEIDFPCRLSAVKDGEEALSYLRREGNYKSAERPAMIFLDLNMPRKDGRAVLAEIKVDPELQDIPVTVLSTSAAEEDVRAAYRLHANCYVQKPKNMAGLVDLAKTVQNFWFGQAALPSQHSH